MIPLRSVKISGHVYNLAVKCQATENTHSVIPQKFSIYRPCIKSKPVALINEIFSKVWYEYFNFIFYLTRRYTTRHLTCNKLPYDQSERKLDFDIKICRKYFICCSNFHLIYNKIFNYISWISLFKQHEKFQYSWS
jgi:hypothetical protein